MIILPRLFEIVKNHIIDLFEQESPEKMQDFLPFDQDLNWPWILEQMLKDPHIKIDYFCTEKKRRKPECSYANLKFEGCLGTTIPILLLPSTVKLREESISKEEINPVTGGVLRGDVSVVAGTDEDFDELHANKIKLSKCTDTFSLPVEILEEAFHNWKQEG